ncbi:MAG: (E)-4-hydroxy-3-methylbut-2-enyl-diphosphate synthase [Bacteroidota bacterium]|nr:(E)-4-hydroxy-3-methylbut-2-enyl-diphosphate synthase [Bacteroidota bacterium]
MYCKSITNYSRFNSKEVFVGEISLGNKNPIRIQTMTNTKTTDIETTSEQIISCFENGADFVRVTTPSMKDVDALKKVQLNIRKYLFDKPIIADIHFNPKIAFEACKTVQKIRINPGNFVDKKSSNKKKYTNEEYNKELDKISDKLKPLLQECRRTNTSIRIGTNHGSLSDRIINKYGNTIKGLVESTFEFLQICQTHDFDDVIVSIKASNPTIMIQANRMFVTEMYKKNLNYPIHLGVTEAGNGIEGRIKSALGIGALLIDGIGDTIRVSLTEKPEKELPVALAITNYITEKQKYEKLDEIDELFFEPFSFSRRKTFQINNIGGSKVPIVIADSRDIDIEFSDFLPDYVITTKREAGNFMMHDLQTIINFSDWNKNSNSIPLLTEKEYSQNYNLFDFCFIEANYVNLSKNLIEKINQNKNVIFIATAKGKNKVGEIRLLYSFLKKMKCKAPVVIKLDYDTEKEDDFIIKASIDSSIFAIDGLADGIFLNAKSLENKATTTDISFKILQASHRRLTKAEFISCPSCGRTLFDLEAVTEKVKIKTSHLKGVKIAIMGCIVNGPGEVADADYGYIGSGKDTVSLFKGKTIVKKDINEKFAVDELINIIKENDDWVDA